MAKPSEAKVSVILEPRCTFSATTILGSFDKLGVLVVGVLLIRALP